ncbi:Ig-like domain repeat protein [Methanobrevibacter sp.]|uniref:Ig-like domain repeat protein n=1 Tax=Methanobrevibacter sp. TaxID=66852 RepID=UPI003890867B
MKKIKLGILISIALIFLLIIGAASAADTVSDDVASAAGDEKLSIDQDDALATGEEVKSFTDLRTDIENGGSEIKLEHDYKYNETVDILDDWHSGTWYGKNNTERYTEGILINKDCTIDGQGHYIDGANVARIFKVDTFRDVTLKNIEFRNGNASIGGAIYSSGKLTLENCIFINNTGGSIYTLEEQSFVSVINDAASYNAQLENPTSALNSYYYNWPREDGVDIDGNPVHTATPKIVGHSWESAISAATDPSETSTFPWVTLKMNNFTGEIVFRYDGEVKYTWYVVEKNYGILSVPNDLGMTDYRLAWNTGTPLDKVFDPSKLQVLFIPGNLDDSSNFGLINNETSYNAQLDDSSSALSKYYTAYPREDAIDANGNPIRDPDTPVAGHSWLSAKSAWTVNPHDPAIQNSTFPWITLNNLNRFTGALVFKYNGATKFVWNVVEKDWAIISVPDDLGMTDYRLKWNTSEVIDGGKEFDLSLLQVIMIPANIDTSKAAVISDEASYNAQLADSNSGLNKYYAAYPREDAIDADGNPIRDKTTPVAGHSWLSAKSAWTDDSHDPAKQNSTFPWIVLNLNKFNGTILFGYEGKAKFAWTVFEKDFGIVSVPNDLGMTDYRLKWNSSDVIDGGKVFDPSKLQVAFLAGDLITPTDVNKDASLDVTDCTFKFLTGTVNADNITYGSALKINGTLGDIGVNTIHNLSIFLDYNKYADDVLDNNNNFVTTIPNVNAGTYTIKFGDNKGNRFYLADGVTNKVTVTANALNPTVTIADSVAYGDDIWINVTVPSDYIGKMNYYVDGEDYGAVSTPSMTIYQLPTGKHNVTITFAADGNYVACEFNKNFTITQAALNPTVTLAESIAYGDAIILKVSVPSDYTGNMNLYVDGGYYGIVSTPSMTINKLPAGKHNVTITFAADGNYAAAADYNKNFTITQAALNPTVVVADSIPYGEDIWINVTVPSDYTGDMNYYIDGEDYGAVSTPSMTIYQLPTGKHNVTITFAADNNYVACEFNKNFTITQGPLNPTVVVADSIPYGEDIWINVTVPSDYTGDMNYYIDGEDYGAVSTPSMTIYQLPVGKHNATITFAADNNYVATEVIKEFYVTKVAPKLDVTIDDITTLDNALTVKSSVDGNYNLEVGSNVVSFTVENGIAMVPIVKLTSGDKIAGVLFRGNENYTDELVYVNFTVNKVASKIASANVNVVYLNNGKITITLTGADNAPIEGDVVVVLNEKEYNATTNANGKATVTIAANLVPDTYKFTAKFNGDAIYKPASKSYSFVITKATPKFTAKNKAFKTTTSPKKYAVILKAGKNVVKKAKVTLRVNGVTYSATTNANGKAIFKITKLSKKGTFTAAIKFKGNDYFNKAYKKVKIVTK